MHNLFNELKRRNVFKVAGVYAVAGWVLIQIAATTFPFFGIPDWGVRLVVGLVLLGFPIALIFAWAFELTADGVKRTEEVSKEHSITKNTGKKLNNIFIIVLILAVIILSYKVFFANQHGAEKPVTSQTATSDSLTAKSIAVLPFENLSSDSSNAYFASGMQDLILSKLAEIGGLTVISRTSTSRYKSHPENLKTIGHQLGVANILEGSVQKAGNRVLINVQLINAGNDHHIWASTYTRTLNDVFGVEGEVAGKVANSLKTTLDPSEKTQIASVPTHNPAAYDAYLRGLSIQTSKGLSKNNMIAADSAFAQAVKLDPNFAMAWGRLSSAISLSYFNNIDRTPANLAKAKQALDQAINLAPDAVETQLAAGDYYYHGLLDYDQALTAYHKALKILPNNAEAIADIGYVERREGHWQSAIGYLKHSLSLDPRNVLTLESLGQSFWSLHNYTDAEEMYREALAINPDDQDVTIGLAFVYFSKGDISQADKIITGSKQPPELLSIWAFLNRHYNDASRLTIKALSQQRLPKQRQGVLYSSLGYYELLAGDHEASRRDYSRAVSILKQVDNWNENVVVLTSLSEAQAGLNEKGAALASAKRAVKLSSHDAFAGPMSEYNLAVVQARVGDKTQAISLLKKLLTMPPGSFVSTRLTPTTLRLAPSWDPLRKEPGFQALLSKYGSQDRETGVGS